MVFHRGWMNRCMGLLGLSWGLSGWAQGDVSAFMWFIRIGAESYLGLHGVGLDGCRD